MTKISTFVSLTLFLTDRQHLKETHVLFLLHNEKHGKTKKNSIVLSFQNIQNTVSFLNLDNFVDTEQLLHLSSRCKNISH